MPSRRQLDQRAAAAEQNAQRREEQAAGIAEHGYYWYYDGGEDGHGKGYKRAHLVKITKQCVFLKHWDWDERSYRCKVSDFDAEGFARCSRGTGVFRYYRGDAVKRELVEEAAVHRREAENLRAQAALTPETEPPSPSSEAAMRLTMYYAIRDGHTNFNLTRPLAEVLRYFVNQALDHALGEDYDELLDIAQAYPDTTMVQMLRGAITVDDFWEITEITERELNDCGTEAVVTRANWIREGF